MDWYYVDAGKQSGPVTEGEIDQLAATGRIQVQTLVWHEGMDNWLPLGQVKPGSATAPPPPLSTAAAASGGPTVASTPASTLTQSADEVVCAHCNRIFPRQDTIQYGSSYVCATCKPAFVQKLKEGALTPAALGTMNYAGFWIRFGAKIIDGLVFFVLLIPFVIIFGVTMRSQLARGQQPNPFGQVGLQLSFQFVFMAATVLYTTFFHGKWGATLGKMACGLRVVTAEGHPISYARSFGRSMAEIVSGMICYIGYIIAAFDSEKRALHDHIASTRVIRVR